MIRLKNLPLSNYYVTSPFGMRELLGYWWHNGIDLRADIGFSVYAVCDGKVMAAADNPAGYGKYIAVDHGGWGTLYAHLSEIKVKIGQEVWAGQIIGLSGNTGMSTGPHLHFEIRVGNKDKFWERVSVNGMLYLRCTDPQPFLEACDNRIRGFNNIFDAGDFVMKEAKLENKTMEFLKAYKYYEFLVEKLANAIVR